MAKVVTAKAPKRVVLEKRFAGIAAGSILYVATPEIVAAWVRAVPSGETRSIEHLRRDLAKRNRADATCPVSTAIFLRSVAEVALRQLGEGEDAEAVVPFWRVIEPGSAIAKRLPVDDEWIAHMRLRERC
jgi:hypothetical protein